MIPTIWPRDILLVRRAALGEISPGEVVLSEREGKLIAHRVVEIRGAGANARIVTQGEALPARDPEISDTELLGSVAAISRGGEWREIEKRPGVGVRIVKAIVRRSSFAARVLLHVHAKRERRAGRPQAAVETTVTWGT